jgi:leader peptidase (prepilin peptidase)/N-methyltransferase
MKLTFSFIAFIFGICVGSFLNCVIYRLETKQSFFRGRSFCPKCHHILRWYELIPILSFIFLKGKCRYCGKKISWQYPLVEISTGIFGFEL